MVAPGPFVLQVERKKFTGEQAQNILGWLIHEGKLSPAFVQKALTRREAAIRDLRAKLTSLEGGEVALEGGEVAKARKTVAKVRKEEDACHQERPASVIGLAIAADSSAAAIAVLTA